jgi:hypothetical protein
MLTIKVLGPGCRNCETLARRTADALAALTEEFPIVEGVTIEKITAHEEFLQYGLMYTPGLVINEKLVSAGRIPAVGHIKGWLMEALATSKRSK